MLILISDAILADCAQWPDLESLLDRTRQNRCYVDTVNPASSPTNHWFAKADARRQQDWFNATSWAAKDAALYRLRTLVADVIADPAAKPRPKITLLDAIELVDRPATLWVENSRNDRRFFLSMMPVEQRTVFLDWEKRRIFLFDSRGGLGELRKALEELAEREALDPRANRALFDSDSEVPGHRSRDAMAMIELCNKASLDYHCLKRRAIENYIPRKALWEWAHSARPKSRADERRKRIEAFDQMSDPQRHHFRLKAGWDTSPGEQVKAFYACVSPADRVTLKNGIDGAIASVYDIFKDAIHGWAIEEGIDPDLQATINEITDWIRAPYA